MSVMSVVGCVEMRHTDSFVGLLLSHSKPFPPPVSWHPLVARFVPGER